MKRGSMPVITSLIWPRGRVEVEVAVDADLDAVAEAEAMALEHRAQAVAAGREHRHVDDRLGVGGVGGVVGEREVGVRSAGVPPLDLAAHPQPVLAAPDATVDHLGQLADGVGALGIDDRLVVDPVLEVELRLGHDGREVLRGGGSVATRRR